MISKWSGIIPITTGLCIIGFSVYFVIYYNSISDNVMQIETEKISSNTEIEANVISKIFVKSVESVVDNLRLISNSPSVQNGDNSGIDLLGLADHNTNNLTDFYVWLDSKGGVIGASSAIDGTNKQLAKDLSNATFFSVPNKTFSPYTSNVT
jgi:hypothetical protein